MAGREHVKILLKGVEAWNHWRKENPDITPDLSGLNIADLAGALADAGGKPNLSGIDLHKADLERAHLPGIILAKADLREAILAKADLSEAVLVEAQMQDAIMEQGCLDRANLHRARLQKALLLSASLQDADLSFACFEGAHLNEAHLEKARLLEANCEGAQLIDARLDQAVLWRTKFQGAKLQGAHLEGADLRASNLENANVTSIHFDRWGKYKGIRVNTCHGSQAFRRHAMDQDFLEEFRAKSWLNRIIYAVWLVTCDCGRSLLLWAGWSVILAGLFTLIFHSLGQESFSLLADHQGNELLPWSWNTMCYYSVVTFTTLGFGDVTPITWWAKFWVMAEVILGYVMLGGLISIFANKLARRSG